MKNLLIRLLSFIICLGLLAGGAILSFVLTIENEDLMKSWQEVQETPWLPALENAPEGGEQAPEGGEQTPEGGEQTPEGGEQTPEGGEQTPEGGEQTPEGGEQTPEGNDPVTE